MPPERLAELQRQRELVRAHLAWLDQEIATAMGRPAVSPPTALPPAAKPLVEAVHVKELEPADPAEAAALARKGCLRVFVIGMVAGVVVLGLALYVFYRDRPLF